MIASPATDGSPAPLGPVVCPSCRHEVPANVTRCPRCGYTGAACMAKFPFAPPKLEAVLDAAGLLDQSTCEAITRGISGLQDEFPQVGVWVCLVRLEKSMQPAEFGFWMINACPVETSEEAIRRLHGALLLVDVTNHRLALTLGYRLEQWLASKSLDAQLDVFVDTWGGVSPGRAILDWVESFRHHLRKAWSHSPQGKD